MHYVISDIHNDYKRFCKMLDKIKFSDEDYLYIVGDVFDRSNHNPNPVDLYFKILSLGNRCSVIRGNHDHWLAMYILKFFSTPEKKRNKIEPYTYNSFDLLNERLTQVDMKELAERILEWPTQEMVELDGKKYLLAHAMTSAPGTLRTEDYFLMGSSLNIFYRIYGIADYISICGH